MRRWRRGADVSFAPARLVVGLGNPGRRYAGTRHNLGFEVCDLLARENRGRWDAARFRAEVWQGTVAERAVALVKPQTFVNESGSAVQAALAAYALHPADLVVVYDDIDLAFGRVRVRASGGAGGHNGMRSILAALGSDEIPRVKIGVGRPPESQAPADYVLQRFAPHERAGVDAALHRGAAAVRALIATDVSTAMQQCNQAPQADRIDGAQRPA